MILYKKVKKIFKKNKNKISLLQKVIETNNHPDFKFIQIGACDGKYADPLHQFIKKYNWNGVLVEPIPYYFEQLKKNYEDSSNLIFINKAISDKNEIRPMYTINPSGFDVLPEWAKGISSLHLDRNALNEKYWTEGRGRVHLDKGYSYDLIKPYIKEINVECITVKKLLEETKFNSFDLLQIDAEGHDYTILKQIDFKKYQPKIIHFEYANLNPDEKILIEDLLRDLGYTLNFHNTNDVLAVKNK